MEKFKFKLFVCPMDLLEKEDINNIGGIIFQSEDHRIENIKETLDTLEYDWVMVDYHHKTNLLLSSKDEKMNYDIIEEYFSKNESSNSYFKPSWHQGVYDLFEKTI